jgi:hypothetical protein
MLRATNPTGYSTSRSKIRLQTNFFSLCPAMRHRAGKKTGLSAKAPRIYYNQGYLAQRRRPACMARRWVECSLRAMGTAVVDGRISSNDFGTRNARGSV